MARPKPIRIAKNDKIEYQRLVRNTKAKINRTLKNYGVDISDAIALPSLESFKTRKEFNKFKDDVQKFTNRANTNYQFKKNKYGVVASVKEINELKRATKKAQKIAKKIQQENAGKPYMFEGVQYGTVGQQEQTIVKSKTGIHMPENFNFDNIASKRHLDIKKKSIEKRSDEQYYTKRKIQFKENYKKAINNSFNSLGDGLIDLVDKINPDLLFEMYLQNKELDIKTYYTEEQVQQHVDKVMSLLQKEVNMDLEGF